jgi:ubiquitin C-terminal hydrolase
MLLQLDVANAADLVESLYSYCAPLLLTGKNQFTDSCTGRRVDARRTVGFTQLPPVLVCHLKRFGFSVRLCQRMKLNTWFDFDLWLRVCDADYALSDIILHSGIVEISHYVSAVRLADGWLLFDDAQVSQIDPATLYEHSTSGGDNDNDNDNDSDGFSAYLLFFAQADGSESPPSTLPPDLRVMFDCE